MTLKKRSISLQVIEVITLVITILILGYFIDNKDPLLVHQQFSFLILWLAIVTLFYGLPMGLVMWLSFAVATTYFYKEDPVFVAILLENLAFVFLFGLFFSNLHNQIENYHVKTNYLRLRLKELSSAFFTLKISHDKLESIYITQPASFRFVIADVLESCEHNTPELSAKNTLKVLKKFFAVNSAMIWRIKRNKLNRCFYAIGEIDHNINPKDKLIQDAIEYKRAIYLKDLEDKEQTSFIYAVPFLDKRNNIVALLIVKDIPFLFYNEDTLLKINVVFNYIWTEYKKRASLDKIRSSKTEAISLNNFHERQDVVDFKLEVVRLNNLLRGFNIESRIYILYTQSIHIDGELRDFFYINEELEVLDLSISITCGKNYIHLILFPFLSKAGFYQKSKTIEKELKHQIGVKSFNEVNIKNTSIKNFNQLLEEFHCDK